MGDSRVRCDAMFLDAGGVIVLPHRRLVRDALAGAGVRIDAQAVAPAHYRAVRLLEQGRATGYLEALARALGVGAERMGTALAALTPLADRRRSGEILWSEPAPDAQRTIAALRRAGIAVVVVTNSDGHAEENLREARICQVGDGPGERVAAIVDSRLVGSEKPDTEIFRVALARAQVDRAAVMHVGDMMSTDVAGARRAGIAPIHLDPARVCRARDHRHVRSLWGIWRHVARP
ncbi:MAG TPA: HAD family hydrolase [Solirubrobacteraceae bacterium]|jgi:putative hydrolase of the HAD superfamily|nr:HAD family hydrolase [Solirubrobacteraceae bacterium]